VRLDAKRLIRHQHAIASPRESVRCNGLRAAVQRVLLQESSHGDERPGARRERWKRSTDATR
jgi:hypothetical protein